MSDSDLEAIRRARLQQLQQDSPNSSSNEQDSQKSRDTEVRASLLSQILEPAAADRLGRIRMVNGERAHDVEERLLMLARSGQLRARVTEEVLKEILSAVAEQAKERGVGGAERVTVQRRGAAWDEDDLDDLLNED